MLSHRVDDDIEIFLLMPHHAESLFALTEANRVYWGEWIGWVERVTTVEAMQHMIEHGLDELAEGTAMRFGVRYQSALAGRAFYSYIDDEARKLEIGYQIGQQYTGQGIVTRVVTAMVAYAFGEMHMNKIEILCATGNTKSQAVPRRLGFRQEGLLRQAERLNGRYHDLIVYGLLAEEWG
jgi:ribosomal-protein-serine acetyltransferase